jgi:hypothetical protein
MSSASTARRGRCASRSATGIVRLRPDADAISPSSSPCLSYHCTPVRKSAMGLLINPCTKDAAGEITVPLLT